MPARGHIRRQSTARPNTVLRVLPGGPGAGLIGSTLLQGSYGEAITFTRASSATMVDASGLVVTKTDNQPRIEAAGLLMERAATNLVLHNRDLTNAAWTKSNTTAAKTATGVDGVANSCSTLTASAGNGTCLQAIVTGAATRNTSVYLKRRTGTGNIDVTRDNGTTWSTVTFTGTGPGGFTRVTALDISALTSGAANPTVGIRIVTSGDAVDVDYFQDEALSSASSAIATAAASATRAVDYATVAAPTGLSVTEGAAAVTVRPLWTGAAPATSFFFDFEPTVNNRRIGYVTATTDLFQAYNGTVNPGVAAGYTAGTPKRYLTQWSAAGNFLRTVNVASGAVDSFAFTAFPSFDATLYIGSAQTGAFAANGNVLDLVISSRPESIR